LSDRRQPPFDLLDVVCRHLEAKPSPPQLLGDSQGGATARKRVQNQLAGPGTGPDDAGQQLLRHLAAVPTDTFPKRPTNTWKVPSVLVRSKTAKIIGGCPRFAKEAVVFEELRVAGLGHPGRSRRPIRSPVGTATGETSVISTERRQQFFGVERKKA